MTPEAAARFWRYVDKAGPIPAHCPELGPCWQWLLTPSRKGYGNISVAGRMYAAHRFAFYLEHGRLPSPCCCHRCDNPGCVRIDHLFEGSNADNVADRVAKRRSNGGRVGPRNPAKGSKNFRARITEADASAIRRAVAGGETMASVSRRYGLGETTVSHLVKRDTWRHVP